MNSSWQVLEVVLGEAGFAQETQPLIQSLSECKAQAPAPAPVTVLAR